MMGDSYNRSGLDPASRTLISCKKEVSLPGSCQLAQIRPLFVSIGSVRILKSLVLEK